MLCVPFPSVIYNIRTSEAAGTTDLPEFCRNAPALAHGLIDVCDLLYADPHSLRLARCLRRRASGRVRNRLDYCGIHLVRVFQAAPLIGLLRTLVGGLGSQRDSSRK